MVNDQECDAFTFLAKHHKHFVDRRLESTYLNMSRQFVRIVPKAMGKCSRNKPTRLFFQGDTDAHLIATGLLKNPSVRPAAQETFWDLIVAHPYGYIPRNPDPNITYDYY
ncbi:hypothetical protein ACOME3_007427 [Neoechinorhynchus agilis]